MSWFKKKLTGPDLELIKKYAEPWDRRYPPVFVGRQAEIGLVEKNCRAALDYCRQGEETAGHFIVFRGAPGAGKTALLTHFKKSRPGKPDCLLALKLGVNTLEDPKEIALAIVQKVDPGKEEQFRQRMVTNASFSGGVPAVVSGEVTVTKDREPNKISFRALKEVLPPASWRQPLCILVDEIQKVRDQHGESLLTLQLGEHGLPIVLVAAGLADSVEKIHDAMSPRLTAGNLHTLAALTPAEVQSCIQQMFDLCRINYSSEQLERITSEIAQSSEGWPQHVRTETAALFGGLAETRGDLSAVDTAKVEHRATEYRKGSYRQRQSGEMHDARGLVADLLRAVPGAGLLQDEMVDLIREKEVPDGPERWRLPKGMDAKNFRDHLIHQGIFHPDGDGKLSCPIPCLRSWLIDRAAPEPDQAKLEEAPEATALRTLGSAAEQAVKQVEPDRDRGGAPEQDRGEER